MKPIVETFSLMASRYAGVLSTNSLDYKGFPFGSMTPYCLNHLGEPMIMISDLAQHTKNIEADPRVCLMIPDDLRHKSPQTLARVSYLGQAEPIDDELFQVRYFSFFPNSKDYIKTHNFRIFRIIFKAIRYIGGFGKIHWLETDAWHRQPIFNPVDVAGAIDHMNEDHRDALLEYLQAQVPEQVKIQEEGVKLINVDCYGFHIRHSEITRVNFLEPLQDPSELRTAFVQLLKHLRRR